MYRSKIATREHPGTRTREREVNVQTLERRNQELESRIASLEERNAALEQFAAMAAHELSEPLIVVESSAILIGESVGDRLGPELSDRLHQVEVVAARARRHVEALLLDARLADRPPELCRVDTAEVVDEVLDYLSLRLEERRATVEVGPLPVIDAAPGSLTVIFDNLIANALRYGPRNGRISVSAEQTEAGWSFQVLSDGPPIPVEEADVLFQRFRRGTGSRRQPGHGLGLAICQHMVSRLGGTIAVTPGPTGNAFCFTLPKTA